MTNHTAQQAQQRVLNSPALNQYYDIICEYDWNEEQEHIDWVCTAEIEEIEAWARGIRNDEE